MLNLLKSEFFKARKSKGIRVVLILSVGIALFYAAIFLAMEYLASDSDMEMMGGLFPKVVGSNALKGVMVDPSAWFVLIAVIASITINNDFKHGIIRNQIMSGKQRYKIYVAKLIVNAVITAISMLLVIIPFTIIYSTKGWGGHSAAAFIVRMLLFMLQIIAFSSLATFIAMLTKNTGITIGILIGMIFLFVIFLYLSSMVKNEAISDIFRFVGELYPGNAAAYAVDYGYKWKKLLQLSITAVVTIGAFSALGIILFKRSDLK